MKKQALVILLTVVLPYASAASAGPEPAHEALTIVRTMSDDPEEIAAVKARERQFLNDATPPEVKAEAYLRLAGFFGNIRRSAPEDFLHYAELAVRHAVTEEQRIRSGIGLVEALEYRHVTLETSPTLRMRRGGGYQTAQDAAERLPREEFLTFRRQLAETLAEVLAVCQTFGVPEQKIESNPRVRSMISALPPPSGTVAYVRFEQEMRERRALFDEDMRDKLRNRLVDYRRLAERKLTGWYAAGPKQSAELVDVLKSAGLEKTFSIRIQKQTLAEREALEPRRTVSGAL